MIPIAFWEGVGVGLAVSVVAALGARWAFHRWARRGVPTVAPPVFAGVVAVPTPQVDPAKTAPPDPTASTGVASHPAAATLAATDPWALPPRDDYASVPTNGGQVRISQRVLLHIGAQGWIAPDEVAPRALCQAGIGEALHVSQGALTGVLRRLVAAGVLEEKRQHVRGADRRVKVYRMTSSGDRLYREIRGRRSG